MLSINIIKPDIAVYDYNLDSVSKTETPLAQRKSGSVAVDNITQYET